MKPRATGELGPHEEVHPALGSGAWRATVTGQSENRDKPIHETGITNPLPADAATIPASARGTYYLPPAANTGVRQNPARLSARRISRRAYPTNSAWSRISPKKKKESCGCGGHGGAPDMGGMM